MINILRERINERQAEHNRITASMEQMRQDFDKLNSRRIEIEGAIKELAEIITRAENNDTKDQASQRSDTDKD